MNDERSRFGRAINRQAARKLKAQRSNAPVTWSGFATFGVIGWSIAAPMLLGALLGGWIDRHHAGIHSWTLALLVAGLLLGCANAWYWIATQNAAIATAARNDE